MPRIFLASRPESLQDHALVIVIITIAVILAACLIFAGVVALLRTGHNRAERHWLRRSGEWEPLLLEILAGARDADALAGAVAPRDRRIFLDFLLGYARRIRGPERATLSRLASPHLQVALPLLKRRGAEHRASAVQILSVLGMPRYTDVVVQALDDPSPVVAMMAARELARPEHPEFGPLVLRRAERFHAWSSDYLATIFADVGSTLCPELRATLADAARPAWVRAVAADALAQLNDVDAAAVAASLTENDDPELLAAACRVLRAVGRPEHVSMLRRMLGTPYPYVRVHAAAALGVAGGPADADVLEDALRDDDPWVALHAARSLAEVAGPERLEALRPGHPRALLLQEILGEVA